MSNRLTYSLLFGVLILFTCIKAPYFNNNFTGYHTMKYNTYVEPAKYMVERGDFTWYQQKYLANPITNPEGGPRVLPQFPLLEWTLACTFSVFKNNTIEFNTRLVTHTIGLITLLFLFLLVKKWSNNLYALIITTLMAINPIVAFATYVTVYDGINFMFLMISLYLLSKYLEHREKLHLLSLSGIIIAIATAIKVSFLIWVLPPTLLFILLKSKGITKKVFDFVVLYLFATLLFLTTKFGIPNLRLERTRSILILVVGLVILITTYLLLKKFRNYISNFLNYLEKKRILIPLLVISVLIAVPIGFNYLANDNLLLNFITDRRLIFNWEFYRYMLVNQFIPSVSDPLFYISVFGFLTLLFVKDKGIKQINLVILFTALFFWVVASKSIFPHSYYIEIIMFGLLLGSTTFIYSVLKTSSTYLRILFLILLIVLAFPVCIKHTQSVLEVQIPTLDEAAKYLEENSKEDEIYIDESVFLALTLKTGRARVGDVNAFSDEEFKKDVKELRFGSAMNKYNVKYLITIHEHPIYENYVHIFTDEYLDTTEFDRGSVVLHMMDPSNNDRYEDLEYRLELVEKYNLRDRFVLEKDVGGYRFFRFVD